CTAKNAVLDSSRRHARRTSSSHGGVEIHLQHCGAPRESREVFLPTHEVRSPVPRQVDCAWIERCIRGTSEAEIAQPDGVHTDRGHFKAEALGCCNRVDVAIG